jgi:hypothetical protein
VTSSIIIAAASVMRSLPLLLSERPKTPLRVLCIMAFDTFHALRHGKRLPKARLRTLAALLDFGACANAAIDHKDYSRQEYDATLERLEAAGLRASLDEFVRRLWNLESGRPLPGGDQGRFQKAVLYREAVVRLSLAMVAATADGSQSLDDAIRAIDHDADLNTLFRIVMHCQIIDDVLDYSKDLPAGLPGFLTGFESLPQAFEHTRLVARGYAGLPPSAAFPLRSALFLVAVCTRLVMFAGERFLTIAPPTTFAADAARLQRPIGRIPYHSR